MINPPPHPPTHPPYLVTRLLHPPWPPTCPPNSATKLCHQNRPFNSSTQLVYPSCGALKTRSYFGLHSGIGHTLAVLDSLSVPVWSLKNKELFQIGLLGRPRLKMKSSSGLDLWIIHAWQVFDSWIVLAWSLKTGRCSGPHPFFLFLFWGAAGLFNCY